MKKRHQTPARALSVRAMLKAYHRFHLCQAERTARAIESAMALAPDAADPFAPGWHESDFGAEAREIVATRTRR